MIRPTLAIVAFADEGAESLDALLRCLVSLRRTAPDTDVLVIEDVAPGAAATLAEAAAGELACAYVAQDDGAGVVAAAAAGLEVARDAGLDALLVSPEVELLHDGWVQQLRARRDTAGRPAAIVGGQLRSAAGLVEHAGYYFSVLTHRWQDRFCGVPVEVAEAHVPTLCPVSLRLALVRHETLEAIGVLDPGFEPRYAELDLCLRAFAAGLECVAEPGVVGRCPRTPAVARVERPAAQAQRFRLEAAHSSLDRRRFIPDLV
jgi:GT2 family glycosyltransferase